MICPNCKLGLTEVELEHQHVFHCKNCGGTFFEENGINRISVEEAQWLAQDKQSDYTTDTEKICPHDKFPLEQITHDDAVPSSITLYRCPMCHGVFVYANQLSQYKQAQQAKVNYFKLWNIPLPSIRAITLLSFAAIISVSLFGGYALFQRGVLLPTQAEDVVTNVNSSNSGRYVFISFRTQFPYTSRIIFTDRSTNTNTEKTVSTKPTTLHYFTTTDLNTNHEIEYRIILTDTFKREITSQMFKLTIK